MENWRKYQNEMRDRYLAPGEDPMDASIEDEELHMHISDKTGEIIDTIFQSPHPVKVNDSLTIGHDEAGDQFLVYRDNDDQPEIVTDEDVLFDLVKASISAEMLNETTTGLQGKTVL